GNRNVPRSLPGERRSERRNFQRASDGTLGAKNSQKPEERYSSILRMTSSAVIMSMQRGSEPRTSTQSEFGWFFASPSSPTGTTRERQQPPVAQQGSRPTVCRKRWPG